VEVSKAAEKAVFAIFWKNLAFLLFKQFLDFLEKKPPLTFFEVET
jgi:hypothetical protein